MVKFAGLFLHIIGEEDGDKHWQNDQMHRNGSKPGTLEGRWLVVVWPKILVRSLVDKDQQRLKCPHRHCCVFLPTRRVWRLHESAACRRHRASVVGRTKCSCSRGDKLLWLLMSGAHLHDVVLVGCGEVVESSIERSFSGGPVRVMFGFVLVPG